MIKFLTDLNDDEYDGKTALVRVDFDVSIKNGNIGEDYRIRMSIPTIDYLIKRNCKVILISHLGRPKDHNSDYSLFPVATRLSEILSKTQQANPQTPERHRAFARPNQSPRLSEPMAQRNHGKRDSGKRRRCNGRLQTIRGNQCRKRIRLAT